MSSVVTQTPDPVVSHPVAQEAVVPNVNGGPLYDVIIIGGGPAGMTAAIYSARKKLKVLMLTKDIGGQAAWSSDVENYLGFTMVSGTDLVKHFQDHMEKFSKEITLKLLNDGITSLAKLPGKFVINAGGEQLLGKSIIIASGKQPKHLGIEGEEEFQHKGVTYCAWCDGPLFKGKDVAIIGGGNSALDAALSIQLLAKNIYIINNQPHLTGDEVMIEKVTIAHNIRIHNGTVAMAINGDKFVRGLTIRNQETGLDKDLAVEGVFVEIGSIPATDYLRGLVDLNEAGEIIIDKHNMSSVPGIFAAGDVTDVVEKQIIIAAGEGSKAAIQCSQWLARLPN
ncbi:FAD-dependent oxidoreductase [Candidatus Saccharibacteria bacterium]|nr:FAD-dependent oxidoreductase [Candidatus Saccharibacteria bacterium]